MLLKRMKVKVNRRRAEAAEWTLLIQVTHVTHVPANVTKQQRHMIGLRLNRKLKCKERMLLPSVEDIESKKS